MTEAVFVGCIVLAGLATVAMSIDKGFEKVAKAIESKQKGEGSSSRTP